MEEFEETQFVDVIQGKKKKKMTNKQKKARAAKKFIKDNKNIINDLKKKGYNILEYKSIPGGLYFTHKPISSIEILKRAVKVHKINFGANAVNLEISLKKDEIDIILKQFKNSLDKYQLPDIQNAKASYIIDYKIRDVDQTHWRK